MKIQFLLVLLLVLFAGCATQQTESSNTELVTVTVVIDNGTYVLSKELQVEKGSTALEAFESIAVLGKDEYVGLGALVTSVNGLEQNIPEELFWFWYVNDEFAPVGASAYVLEESGTKIEFRYHKDPHVF